MDRDEILRKSREENRNRDMEEKEVISRSSTKAYNIGILACAAIALLDFLIAGRCNYAVWFVYCAMCGTLFLLKARRLKHKHEIVYCILLLTAAVLFLMAHILQLYRVIP